MYDVGTRSGDMAVAYDYAAFRLLEGNYHNSGRFVRLYGAAHQLGLLERVDTGKAGSLVRGICGPIQRLL